MILPVGSREPAGVCRIDEVLLCSINGSAKCACRCGSSAFWFRVRAAQNSNCLCAMWPEIPYEPWRETCSALRLYAQVVGKYRLARTPWVNHSWHATLYVNARGVTTSIIPDGAVGVEIAFDLLDHVIIGATTDGRKADFPLGSMSVGEFHARFLHLIGQLGASPRFDGRPNEVPNPIPFRDDRQARPYDADAVTRFFQAIVGINRVLNRFRTGYIGKVSPVHLFWGSFDLAMTRFSGRRAPLHPGGIPALPDEVTARHTVTRSRPQASGREAEEPISQLFILMRIPHRRVSVRRCRAPKKHTSIRVSGNSCYHTRRYENRATLKRRSCRFLRALIMPQPIWAAGIVTLLNVQ